MLNIFYTENSINAYPFLTPILNKTKSSTLLPPLHNRINNLLKPLHLLLNRRSRRYRINIASHIDRKFRPASQHFGCPRSILYATG